MKEHANPMIIQGGMGVAVSGWPLARAVAATGHLGVVSGTAIDVVFLRRLQLGDPGGHLRRALAEFPFPEMAARQLQRYFVPGGKEADVPFVARTMPSARLSRELQELIVVGNFVEVFLAKEGHPGPVGVNYLEKVQLFTLPSLYGAMLADVDYVLMGAGIPVAIPGVLDRFADGEAAELTLHVEGADTDLNTQLRFDPSEFTADEVPWLKRPKFLAIVASATLASMLARKASGHVDGFVVEGPTAGGHNAPPRGKAQLNDRGEPIYGPRDEVDLAAIAKLGRPFWLAGSYGSPAGLRAALASGAAGIQVGTAFAFCEESGLTAEIRREVRQMAVDDRLRVRTDPTASPTGFPFKLLDLEASVAAPACYRERQRRCDLGYLRQAYRTPEGTIGWRCPAENTDSYVRKGGAFEDAQGRMCLCNGLLANVGLAQVRSGVPESPLITCGDGLQATLAELAPQGDPYSARDVIEYLRREVESAALAVEPSATSPPARSDH